MKRLLISLMISLLISIPTEGADYIIKGYYQGESIFVKNPFAATGVGFCVYEVLVNGLTTTDEINSSAFEINLTRLGLSIGDDITVTIRYKSDCKPMVVNPQALIARASFNVKTMRLNGNRLEWFTTNERGKLPYYIEQFMWNKWVRIGEVMGMGTPQSHSYATEVRFHSGLNRFRLRQTDEAGTIRYSQELSFFSDVKKVTFTPDRVDDVINFSSSTLYEIYDAYGNIVFKGYGTTVRVGGLKKGNYYLNYDNQMGQFVKK
ncbi:hypothetical protein LX69_00901 [Breznakibacter xylanolyticus]|uniref:Secreted protein (Por secretion system target) n=1 Tax=Breznakibacter xylanolyticus TaxID=990 RepID=A0A2W7NRK5_9BACT|nr:hypothetical protein [Breznakibacter xylanolyticus]PZX19234.1 hypothetical protein LX69_00901 [Breznakibacter xylanolyticus]